MISSGQAIGEFMATDIGHSVVAGMIAGAITSVVLGLFIGDEIVVRPVALVVGIAVGLYEYRRMKRPLVPA